MDRYIFFSIPIELEKQLIPVNVRGHAKHVGHIVVRELASASTTEISSHRLLARSMG